MERDFKGEKGRLEERRDEVDEKEDVVMVLLAG